MGDMCPPWYGEIELIDKITKVDEKINELLVLREQYVENLKESIKKKNNSKE